MRSFDLSPTAAREMLERIEFVHVYGSLGPLLLNEHPDPVHFGDLNAAFTAAKNLSLAAPRTIPNAQKRIEQLIEAATRVVFLGFGFWKENLDILHPGNGEHLDELSYENAGPWGDKQIFASRFKLWGTVFAEVNDRIGTIKGEPIVSWGGRNQTIWDFVTNSPLNV